MTESTELAGLLARLRELVPDARGGLPQPVFYFATTMTPMVNVDLLVQNHAGETLLAYRHDEFYVGWHVVGGIIRFKETVAQRIHAVAALELGATVTVEPGPLAFHEKIHPTRDVRGHFISLLYRCTLVTPPDPGRRCVDMGHPAHGQWAWHGRCPETLIPQHDVYRGYFAA